MIQKANFQPNKVLPNRYSIAGLLAVAAVRGMVVNRKTGADDTVELATGKAGYFLRRDVADAATRKTFVEQDLVNPDKLGFEMPYAVGGSVQAEDYEEFWVEGPDLLAASMDVNAAVRAPITTAAGKLTLLTNSETEEVLGLIVLNEPAANHDAPARRFLIQVARGAKAIVP